MSEDIPTNGKERADYVEVGDTCPMPRCDETIGEGHWIAFPSGSSAYDTDKEGTARTWQERAKMNVVPEIEPTDINH